MISLPENILKDVKKQHTQHMSVVINSKIKVLELCLKYYHLQNKLDKKRFTDELFMLNCSEHIKRRSLNWFLSKSTKSKDGVDSEHNHVNSLKKLENFFDVTKRIVQSDFNTIKEINKRLTYLNTDRIKAILSGSPSELLSENTRYHLLFREHKRKHVNKTINNLILYLFEYPEFSKKGHIYCPDWNAYQFTYALNVNTCLYCNRNYIITVKDDKESYIRAELDHFYPQSAYPLLALSFYNLIPSCHVCNSNLKNAKNVSHEDFLHPYMYSYCNENAKFTYKVNNPDAFFNDPDSLLIKIDTSKCLARKSQINKNVELFKLNEIYSHHNDVAESLMDLKRKTSKTRLKDIFENILVSNRNQSVFSSKKEVYEFAIRNYYTPTDFFKKPLAKFEKDIATEIGLI